MKLSGAYLLTVVVTQVSGKGLLLCEVLIWYASCIKWIEGRGRSEK